MTGRPFSPAQQKTLAMIATDAGPLIGLALSELPAGSCMPGALNFSYQLDGITVIASPHIPEEFCARALAGITSEFQRHGWALLTDGPSSRVIRLVRFDGSVSG